MRARALGRRVPARQHHQGRRRRVSDPARGDGSRVPPVANPSSPRYTPGRAWPKRTMAQGRSTSWRSTTTSRRTRAWPAAPRRRRTAPASRPRSPSRLRRSMPKQPPQSAAAAPPVTGCAQIEATSTQDKLQGGQTDANLRERSASAFAENSAELPPDADALTGEVAELLAQQTRHRVPGHRRANRQR